LVKSCGLYYKCFTIVIYNSKEFAAYLTLPAKAKLALGRIMKNDSFIRTGY
jgi:hypothetical protein